MRRTVLIAILSGLLILPLPGCGSKDPLSPFDSEGIGFLRYTDIDTVCDDPLLAQEGSEFLCLAEDQLLLSYVMDSSIELSDVLGSYDHLVITNPRWIDRFGDVDRLQPIPYESLTAEIQQFLADQIPILTAEGTLFSEGIGLYQYQDGGLLAFPVNVTLGMAEPVEAENPLILLVERPAQTLRADTCLLPLTSSGNVLFSDAAQLQEEFEASALRPYAALQEWTGPA